MLKRFNTSLLVLVISFATFALSGTQSVRVAFAAPVSSFDLLRALPASDFIVFVDTQRIQSDVIPAILADRPEARAKLESDIEKFKKHVGLDPRLLDGIAIGVNFNASRNRPGFAVIARGRFDASATIESGLTLAGKESRGELTKRTIVYEGRTLSLLAPTRASTDNNKESDYTPSDEVMTFVALDSNTVAFGNLKSVRATIDASMGKGRVDDELVQLATRTPNAAVCFSGKVSPEMASHLRIGSKEAEGSIASMKQVYGSFNSVGNDAELQVNVRMNTEEDVRKVSMALNAAKLLARFGTSQISAEKRSIATMIQNVEINNVGNEVQISAKVALSDLAPFIPKR